jgi:hypothetical protein
MKLLQAAACFGLCAFALGAHAGLFLPKDTRMAMAMYAPDAQAVELAYGFTRELGGTMGWHRYENDAGDVRRDYFVLRANYLVFRSYGESGIANAYVMGGPAWARDEASGDERMGAQVGFWADYETRRIYTRFSTLTHWTSAYSQTVNTAQALWAPYAADYEDLATWIGVQVERRNGLSDATQITPLLRLFQRNWWVDAGVSVNDAHRGDVFLNLMFLF